MFSYGFCFQTQDKGSVKYKKYTHENIFINIVVSRKWKGFANIFSLY